MAEGALQVYIFLFHIQPPLHSFVRLKGTLVPRGWCFFMFGWPVLKVADVVVVVGQVGQAGDRRRGRSTLVHGFFFFLVPSLAGPCRIIEEKEKFGGGERWTQIVPPADVVDFPGSGCGR